MQKHVNHTTLNANIYMFFFYYLCHLDLTLRITLVETTALGTIFLLNH